VRTNTDLSFEKYKHAFFERWDVAAVSDVKHSNVLREFMNLFRLIKEKFIEESNGRRLKQPTNCTFNKLPTLVQVTHYLVHLQRNYTSLSGQVHLLTLKKSAVGLPFSSNQVARYSAVKAGVIPFEGSFLTK
jgi:hypothetical protein